MHHRSCDNRRIEMHSHEQQRGKKPRTEAYALHILNCFIIFSMNSFNYFPFATYDAYEIVARCIAISVWWLTHLSSHNSIICIKALLRANTTNCYRFAGSSFRLQSAGWHQLYLIFQVKPKCRWSILKSTSKSNHFYSDVVSEHFLAGLSLRGGSTEEENRIWN